MLCNICTCDVESLLNKPCCTFNMCLECYNKQTNKSKCPCCGREVDLLSETNTLIVINNYNRINAKDASIIANKSKPHVENEIQRKKTEKEYEIRRKTVEAEGKKMEEEMKRIANSIKEEFINEIYDKIKELSNKDIRYLKYCKRIDQLKHFEFENDKNFNSVNKLVLIPIRDEFLNNSYGVLRFGAIYPFPKIMSLFVKHRLIIELSW